MGWSGQESSYEGGHSPVEWKRKLVAGREGWSVPSSFHGAVVKGVVLCCGVWHGVVWCCVVLCGVVWCGVVCTVLFHDVMRCSLVSWCGVLV